VNEITTVNSNFIPMSQLCGRHQHSESEEFKSSHLVIKSADTETDSIVIRDAGRVTNRTLQSNI